MISKMLSESQLNCLLTFPGTFLQAAFTQTATNVDYVAFPTSSEIFYSFIHLTIYYCVPGTMEYQD